jgi:glycosyltransferase involved in cell wall biosynthesis
MAAALGEQVEVRLFQATRAPFEYPRDGVLVGLTFYETIMRPEGARHINAPSAALCSPSSRSTAAAGVAPKVVGTEDVIIACNSPSCMALLVSQPYANDLTLHILSSLVSGVPVLFSGHGDNSRRPLYDEVVSWAPARVTCLEQSETAAEDTRGAFYRPQVRLVRGGIDDMALEEVTTAGILARARQRRLLYVGRLLPHKGIDHLIKAACQLSQGWSLDLCYRESDPSYEAHLRKLALHSGPEVTFRRDLPDAALARVSKSATLAVCPSTHITHSGYLEGQVELLGIVILEMVALGVPVISSDIPAYAETMELLGLDSWLFPDGDVSSLAQLIESVAGQMSAEPAEVVRCLEGAQERIGEFSWRRWARAVLASLHSAPKSEHLSSPGHATHGVDGVARPDGVTDVTEGAASGGLGQ